ncbi:MAG TPA: GTP-binding protein, partial [Candidatus Omnitrophica bacterium]|nr:GTP-binding protein [Candidatus Omnitrophota bacterium]
VINNTAKISALEPESGVIKIAIIGRPNAGKSSFLNKLIKDDRVLVDSVPGTTRDSVDTHFTFGDTRFMFIDTAGIRHRGKVKAGIDYFSSIRTEQSMAKADAVLFIIDGYEGLKKDDLHFIYKIWEAKKGLVIAVNKKDLIKKPIAEYEKLIRERLVIAEYIPLIYMSAKTGEGVEKAVPVIKSVYDNLGMRITTSRLNSFISEIKYSIPKMVKGRKMFKIYYATQAEVYPPAVVFTVNYPELINKSFFNFLERKLRQKFGFLGAPIRLIFKSKKK